MGGGFGAPIGACSMLGGGPYGRRHEGGGENGRTHRHTLGLAAHGGGLSARSNFCRFFLPQNPERSAPQFLMYFFTFWPYPEKMEVRRLLLLFSFGADAVATVVRHGRWPD